MKQLDKERLEMISAFRKEEEESFVAPEFKTYHIRYVKAGEKADLQISQGHTIQDFLAIGVVALGKSVAQEEGSKEILVSHKTQMATEIGTLYTSRISGGKSMPENAIMGVMQKVDYIYQKTYHGKCPAAMVGLNFCMCISAHLLGAEAIPQKEAEEYFFFENFEDTVAAQEKVFALLSRIHSATMAGVMAELME